MADRSPLIDVILLFGVGAVIFGAGFAVWYYVLQPLVRSWWRRRR